MSKFFGKDIENAVNSVVEAMVRKLLEVQEKLKQKEADFINVHETVINELEKDIFEQYENQRFRIEGEKGIFDIKKVQDGNVILTSDDKSLSVSLEKLDLIIKPIEQDKGISGDLKVRMDEEIKDMKVSQEISENSDNTKLSDKPDNKFLEKFLDETNEQIDHIISQKEKGRDYFAQSIPSSDNPAKTEKEYKELEQWNKTIDEMKEAKRIILDNKNINNNTPAENELSRNVSELKVMKSAAGYYLGREIIEDGVALPYDRQSEYFKSEKEVNIAFDELIKSKTIEKVNHEVSNKLEKNITISADANLIPSQIRAKLEVLDHLKNMNQKEILNALKLAEKQGKKEGLPVEQVYRNILQTEINQNIRIYKERALDVAIEIHERNKEIRQELRSIETKINSNMGVLYQAKLENKLTPEQYNQLKDNLDIQKANIDNRLLNIKQNEQKINDQLKLDLKQQIPDLKTDKLSLNESITLAKAAYMMTDDKTIENLKNFSLVNNLKEALQTIDKVTKEVEFEIKEITEVVLSR